MLLGFVAFPKTLISVILMFKRGYKMTVIWGGYKKKHLEYNHKSILSTSAKKHCDFVQLL